MKIHYANRPLTLDVRQPKVKEALEFTDWFLLTTLSPPLNSHGRHSVNIYECMHESISERMRLYLINYGMCEHSLLAKNICSFV